MKPLLSAGAHTCPFIPFCSSVAAAPADGRGRGPATPMAAGAPGRHLSAAGSPRALSAASTPTMPGSPVRPTRSPLAASVTGPPASAAAAFAAQSSSSRSSSSSAVAVAVGLQGPGKQASMAQPPPQQEASWPSLAASTPSPSTDSQAPATSSGSSAAGKASNEPTCPVCLDAPLGVRLVPCGHALCRGCLELWRKQSVAKAAAGTSCPFCREPIQSSTKIHSRGGRQGSGSAAAGAEGSSGGACAAAEAAPASASASASRSWAPASPQHGAVAARGGGGGATPPRDADAPVIVWFRRDLRTADNPALDHASSLGRPVLPVFIWAPQVRAAGALVGCLTASDTCRSGGVKECRSGCRWGRASFHRASHASHIAWPLASITQRQPTSTCVWCATTADACSCLLHSASWE